MRGVTALAPFAALAIAGPIAGCGSTAAPAPVSGAAVFRSECSSCHSLIGNESLHRQGGDLVGYRMTRQELTQFTREMPVKNRLSQAQLAAVVAYVWAAQHPTAGR